MKKRFLGASYQASAGLIMLMLLGGCASKLKHQIRINTPSGGNVEEAIDLTQLNFIDVDTERPVNLKDYMDREGRDYLLLVFGSRGCGLCNHEDGLLRDEVVDKSYLYSAPEAQRFELIGVNVDDAGSRDAVVRFRAQKKFYFIRWSDPNAETMTSYLLPQGTSRGVPFMVMITRRGIAWRSLNDQTMNVSELVGRIAKTIGLDASKQPDAHKGGGSKPTNPANGGTPSPGPVLQSHGLDEPGEGRLRNVAVRSCAGTTSDLETRVAGARLRFVQVASDSCGSDCLANARVLNDTCTGECTSQTLAVNEPNAQACDAGVMVGGASFFEVFKSFFNWHYLPVEHDDASLELPAVKGPLVLGFDAAGKLIFGREGIVTKGDIKAAIAQPTPPRGPDFPFWSNGDFHFADLRQKTQYTIVSTWARSCETCVAELQAWSAPGTGLFDVCTSRGELCQMVGLNTDDDTDHWDAASYMKALYAGSSKLNWVGLDHYPGQRVRIPQILDPQPYNGADGKGYLHKFFDGYLVASFYALNWSIDPRTVVYDREGKIVAAFHSTGAPEEPQEVTDAIRALLDKASTP